MKTTLFLSVAFLVVATLGPVACGGAAPGAPAPKGDAVKGQKLFAGTCGACHGLNAQGIKGMGKDLTTSEFVADKNDDDLVAFIKVGRSTDDPANTTGVAMLPKGGNPALTDSDLYDIVAYIRTLQKK
jgi:disulfide bond formation protein DsbB